VCLLAAGTETAEELLQRASSSGNGNGDSPVLLDGRAFRRSLNKTGRYVRKPVDDKESLELMEEHGVGYSSTGLIARMRANGNTWQEGVSPLHKLLTARLMPFWAYLSCRVQCSKYLDIELFSSDP
jgi:hypothetical protein